MGNRTESKKRINALDIFIIASLILCIAAACCAFLFNRQNAEETVEENQLEEYVISFKVQQMRKSSAEMITSGKTFYTSESKDFGVLQDDLKITPAVVYIVSEEGESIKTYAPENGDYTKVDVSGTFIVKGGRDSRGIFLLNGSTALAPNSQLSVIDDTVSFPLTVTGIEKVSK